MIPGPEVLQRHVNPGLIEEDFSKKPLRKRITYRYVLQAEVSHIQKIFALNLHSETRVGTSQIPCPWIESIIVGVSQISFCVVMLVIIFCESLRQSAFLS